MTLKELKTSIKNYTLPETFFIFVHPKNTFLVNRYIDAMCETLKIEKTYASSIFEQDSALSLVMSFDNKLKVIHVDEFTEYAEDYSQFTNTVVVCEKIKKELLPLVTDYVVEFGELEEWQIKAYMKQKCPGLSDEYVDELFLNAGKDIYRINNELDKISLFEADLQNSTYVSLRDAKNSDLFYIKDAYAIVEAILSGDLDLLKGYLTHRNAYSFEFYQIYTSLLAKVKGIYLTRHCPSITDADLEITAWQLKYLRAPAYHLTDWQLKRAIRVLSDLDVRVKSGTFDMSSNAQIDYILTQLVN
jgi:hypothetical protein